MKITLLVEGARHLIDVTQEGITIGRGEMATIRVASNAVSRVHARIFLDGEDVYAVDLKSLNGTTLNGVMLSEPRRMHPGDSILLGELAVKWLPDLPHTATGSYIAISRQATETHFALEDRAFDEAGSILVPQESLEAMLAASHGKQAFDTEALFKSLASMAGTLLRASNLQELLDAVMNLVTYHIPCQRGFILLAGVNGELVPEMVWEEKPGSMQNPISRTIARTAMRDRVAILTTDARVDPRFSAGESIKIHGITSALCAPLIVDEQPLGAIYLESSLTKGGFKPENQHLLSAMATFAAVGIQREREARFRQRLERYHSPQVVGEILKATQAHDAPMLQAKRCEITVLFADISGFTRMSEALEPLQVADILNRSFEVLTDQIFAHGGTLDKFIGDGIMAFFGAPAPDKNHARNAVDAAIGMQRALEFMNDHRPEGFPELRMRIGINSGEAFAGDIGCEKRMDYTVMGATVNLASRLESSICRPREIVIGPRTAELIGRNDLEEMPPSNIRGMEHEISTFRVPW